MTPDETHIVSDPKQTVVQLYQAFGRGDVPAVLEGLAEDVSWTEAEGFPGGGTYIGRQAVLDNVFMKLGGDWEVFTVVPAQFVAEGDTVVALGEYSGTFRATGKSFRAPFVHVWTLAGGRAVRFHQHTDTAVVQRALQV